MQQNVFIADDDEAVRDSLRLLLETAGYRVETFSSGKTLLSTLRPEEEACLVIDVKMPELGGLEVQERLRAEGFSLPVVIITGHGDVPLAVQAMKAGAVDFVEKPFSEEMILGAVARAFEIERQQRESGAAAAEARSRLSELSERERQVLSLLVAGKPNKVIAHELVISPRTVEIHRARVMEKTRAHSLSELVRLALTAGLSPGSS
jgi:two-component system, LuxR family, response regulator FixJ